MQRSLRLAHGPLAQVSSSSTRTASRAYSSYYPRASATSTLPTRPFHTTPSMQTSRDRSTIDFAYMPQMELNIPAAAPEIERIPLLPSNFDKPRDDMHHHEAIEPVSRPIIHTVSADSTHIHRPSAMTDVTDNHAIDINPYDLPNQVTSAAHRLTSSAAAAARPDDPSNGTLKEFWAGLMDDIFGARKVAHA